MIYRVFAVYDEKIAAYMQPFFSPTIASGIRAFADAASDPNSMLNKHPADFTLCVIGNFHDDQGELIPEEINKLGTAAEHLNLEQPNEN